MPARDSRVRLRNTAPPGMKICDWVGRSAPLDSISWTRGSRLRSAISMARRVLRSPNGLVAPPRTVGSLAVTTHSTPATGPTPVTPLAPPGSRSPGGQRRQLQERPVAVDQQLDPLPGQQLAPGPVALHVLRPAARPGLGQQPVELGQQLLVGGPVGPVGVRGRVEPAPEHAHREPPALWLPRGNHGPGPAPDRQRCPSADPGQRAFAVSGLSRAWSGRGAGCGRPGRCAARSRSGRSGRGRRRRGRSRRRARWPPWPP